MNRDRITSIEDRFVDAVKSVLESGLDWSTDPVILFRRTVESDTEAAEFVNSSYMSRAAYNLGTNDLRITLRTGEILRIAPISVEYWDRLLAAPSKGRFFLRCIKPHHNVERLNAGLLKRICGRFKSRLQIL